MCTTTFFASLGKFGQKSFAPQKFACSYTYAGVGDCSEFFERATLCEVRRSPCRHAQRPMHDGPDRFLLISLY